MASKVIEDPTDSRTDRQCFLIGMSLEENRFVTVPEQAALLQWAYQSELEEKHFATMPMQEACLPWARRNEPEEKHFATVPMIAVSPARSRQRELEEEWHTSFEQAISERAARVSQQLRHLSTTGLDRAAPATDPLPIAPPSLSMRARRYWRERKRAIILFCLSLGLFLVGFDLMGLLVVLR